ncbi:MAG: EAL domain-containing protein [Acidimicrobiales bacterium]
MAESRTTTAAEQAEISERRFHLAFENSMGGVAFVDLADTVLEVNEAFCEMMGLSKNDLVGKHSKFFTHPDDHELTDEARRRLIANEADHVTYMKRYLKKGGWVIDVEVSESITRDVAGAALCLVVCVRDITRERALIAQLSHQALHDQLTGLANRALFEDRFAQATARAARRDQWNAVMLLDLDDFKAVNDALGHHVGDQLLVAIARRLEEVTRSSDTLCRLGSDEFLYLAEGFASPSQAEAMARRLLGVFSEPIAIDGTYREQRASLGIVVFDHTCKNSAELIQDADVAVHEAKRAGKGRHVLFTPPMYEEVASRFELSQELGRSLQSGELSMHYQPIVDLTSSDVVGFEALMRWQNPKRGPVPPDVFIPLAEQSDLIFELGAFALREAVADAMSWDFPGAVKPYVTVNLSARQFHDPDLVSMIEGALNSSGLDPGRLVLEITESAALRDVAETKRIIEHLDHLGVAVALDDFGTGYSSLAYLTLLRPSTIKIDRSFVSTVHESAYNDTLLEAIVSLGHKLDMTVLGEGIETRVQHEHLRHLQCELGQGFLFSPAVPAGDAEAMLLGRKPIGWGQSQRSGLVVPPQFSRPRDLDRRRP